MKERFSSSYVARVISSLLDTPLLSRIFLISVCSVLILYGTAIMLMLAFMPAQFEEWEGKILCEAWNFSQNIKMYRDPVHNAAASVYTPLYHWTLGQILRVFPASFLPGRLLSLISTGLIALGICCFFAKRSPRNKLLTITIAAMFISLAWNTAWHFAAVRVDMLCHLLCFSGMAILILSSKKRAVIASAFILALSFFAKQTAVIVLPGIVLFFLIEDWKKAFFFISTFAIFSIIFYQVFVLLTGEYFSFYVFGRTFVQAKRCFPVSPLLKFFLSPREIPLILIGTIAAILLCRELWNEKGYRLSLLSFPFLFVASCLTSSAPGAAENSMIPGFIVMIVLGGYSLEYILNHSEKQNLVIWMIAILLIFHFDKNAPYRISKARGKFDQDFTELVQYLKDKDGAMYAPTYNVITLFAGKPCIDDYYLAKEIGWHWHPNPAIERITRKVNSGQYQWLIFSDFHKDVVLLQGNADYKPVHTFDDWTVYKKTD